MIKADSQATVAIEGITKLKAEIVLKEVQLATLRNSMTDESNEVKSLLAGISRLKSQLAAMTGSGGTDNVIPSTGNVPGIAKMSPEDAEIISNIRASLSTKRQNGQ